MRVCHSAAGVPALPHGGRIGSPFPYRLQDRLVERLLQG